MLKIVSLIVVLSVFTQIHTLSVDQFIRLTQGNANLKELSELSEMLRENRGDIEERQAAAPAATPAATPAASTPATPAATTPAATPAASSNLSSLISGVVGALGTAFAPFLGPLQPLADSFGPLLNSAFTNIFTNALNGLVGVLRSNDLPNSGYDTYLVNIPNQGSFIILAKSQEKPEVVAPPPAPIQPQSPTLSELLSNAIRQNEMNQQGDAKTPLTAAVGASIVKKKPLLIPLSLLTALAGASKLAKNQKSYSDYEIIMDEN